MHLYHYPTYQTIECELQKLALGGKTKLKEPYPITLHATLKSQTLGSSWTNGNPYTTRRVEKEVSSTESQLRCKSKGSVEETLTMILEQIHALRLSLETMSSVISQKSSSDQPIVKMTSLERLDWPRSWVHGNQPSQTLNTTRKDGKTIVKRKGYSELA